MKNYDSANFTWGAELEWGDIPRDLQIPDHLGSWEYTETDVLNLLPPYALRAADPLGLNPPVGGEINTKPTLGWQKQVERIMEIKNWFEGQSYTPTASFISHTHAHVFIPGLREDLSALKKLVAYIRDNQHDVLRHCYQYEDHPTMKGAAKGAKMYLKYDSGRPMPDYIIQNLLTLSQDFNHFIKLHGAGKNGVSMGRPFRYGINTYCLKHTGTVEFRCFQNTVEQKELESIFKFCEEFISAALNDGPNVIDILRSGNYNFPAYKWNREYWDAFVDTKWDKSRSLKKNRVFHEVP